MTEALHQGPLNDFLRKYADRNAGVWWRELLEKAGYDGVSNRAMTDVVVFNPEKQLLPVNRPNRPAASKNIDEVYTNARNIASPDIVHDTLRTLYGTRPHMPRTATRIGEGRISGVEGPVQQAVEVPTAQDTYVPGSSVRSSPADVSPGPPSGPMGPHPDPYHPGALGAHESSAKLRKALMDRGYDAVRHEDGRVEVFDPNSQVKSPRNDAQGVSNTVRYRSDQYQQTILSELIGGPVPLREGGENWKIRMRLLDTARRLRDLKSSREHSVLRKGPHDLATVRETLILKIEIDRAMGKSLDAKTNSAVRQLESLTLKDKTPAGRLAEIQRLSRTVREMMQGQRVFTKMLEAEPGKSEEEFIIKAVSEMYHSKWTDRLFELWVNNILSGPVTHAINIASTGMNTFMRPVERVMQSIAATTRFDFQEASATMTEAKAMMVAIPETITNAIKMVKNGKSVKNMLPEELRQQHELYYLRNNPAISAEGFNKGGAFGAAMDFVGKFIRLPGELLLKEDMVFKMLNYRMSVNANAARKAITQGKTHGDTKALYRLLKDNPSEQMRNQAVDQASYYTFTHELSGNFKKMQQLRNGVPGARWILPFFQTPTNLVTQGIRHSVFGNIYRDLLPALSDATAVGDLARAKLALGSMVPVMLLQEMGDNITGPINTETPIGRFRAQMGQMPYSIRMGGQWISYEGLEPLRTILGTMVDFRDSMDNIDWEEPEAAELTMQLALTCSI
jgi:hypothetical protein